MQFLLVANFKSNKTTDQALSWLKTVGPQVKESSSTQVVVCPQFPVLESSAQLIKSSGWQDTILLGAQNLSAKGEGAFTGEVAAQALKDSCQYVIVGHSERRSLFGETAADIEAKVEQALSVGVKPIICVSQETVTEVETYPGEDCAFAFEPPAAIGRGQPEDVTVIAQTIAGIQQLVGETAPILYGGSVKAQFVAQLQAIKGLNGFLVGSASLEPASFLDIYHAIR